MTSQIIDVDKYERFLMNDENLDDSTGLKDNDGYSSAGGGLLADFLPIDADIIDYGISEDELEDDLSSLPVESSVSNMKVSSSDGTEKRASVNYTNVNTTSKSRTKSLSIKVVDCDKFPWYYAKYEKQILKRKYFDAVKQARNIVKCPKSNESKPSVFIDLDDLSANSDDCKSYVKKDKSTKIDAPENTFIVDKTVNSEKEFTENGKIMKKNGDSEMIQEQKAVSDILSSTEIDLKRNKGLIGMKVQKNSANDKIKETKYTQKSGKHKEKTKKQKEKHFSEPYEKLVDKKIESFCHSTELAVLDKKQMFKKSTENKNQNKNDDENTQKAKRKKLKKHYSLTCSLKISSPQILMKFKKIIPENTKENNIAAHQFANDNEDNKKVRSDRQQLSNDYNKVIKYKPMPKSKRFAMEKCNKHIEQAKLKDIKDQSKKEIEQLKAASTISISLNKHSTNSEKITATYFKQKHIYNHHPPFLYKNKLPDSLRDVAITPEVTNEISKTQHSKEFLKKDLLKKKKTLDQSKAFKSVEPLQPVLTSGEHNINSGNKHAASTTYNTSSLKEGLTPVIKQIPLDVGKNDRTEICSDIRGSSLTNQNMNSNNVISLNNKNNLTKTINKLKEAIIKQTTTPKSLTVCKSGQNSMSISSQSSSEKKTTLNHAHIRKQTYNLPVNNANNIDDFIKCNNQTVKSNIQSVISPQESSGPHEYIVPDVNLPQQLSLYRILSQSKDADKKNQLNGSKQPQSNILPGQDMKPTQCNNSSMYNPDKCILSNNNIGKDWTHNLLVNKNDTPQNMQIPARIGHPKSPVTPGTSPRPTKIKEPNPNISPQFGARFQRPSPGQMPYAVRSQSPLRLIRPWRFDFNQRLNYRYRPRSYNIHRMALPKPTYNYNHQNNYTQRPVYNQWSYDEMLHHGNIRPPGLCNVDPNNVPWPYRAHYPSFSQPPTPLPTHQNPTNSETCSLVGKHVTGLVKKINILKSDDSKQNNKVDSKEVNTNPHANISINMKTVNNGKKTYTVSVVDDTTPVLTKSEMLKELEKAMESIQSPVKLETKRLYPSQPSKEQVNYEQTRRTGPLSKKIKFDHELTTAPHRVKQIRKTGYSPPILPITAFQNILSEVSIAAPSGVTCETPLANQSAKLTKSFKNNKSINTLQSKCNNNKQYVQTDEDNFKKISLEEYKKRSLMTLTAQKCAGTKELRRNVKK